MKVIAYRARLKSLENLPGDVRCCPQRIELFRERREVILIIPSISRIRPYERSVCSFCRSHSEAGVDVRMIPKFNPSLQSVCEWTALELMDIDEGSGEEVEINA